MKAFLIVVLDRHGKETTVQLESENHAVDYLKKTHSTEAVVSFTFACGTPVPHEIITRIHDQVFKV